MKNNINSREIAAFTIYLLSLVINAVYLKAQNPGNSAASKPTTEELHPSLNQGTNQISAQKVEWTDDRGLSIGLMSFLKTNPMKL
jgi:hypothetical protein